MATTKAGQKAVNKYIKNNYDRIDVTVPKGHKQKIKTYAESIGQSTNSFINSAINQALEGKPATQDGGTGVDREKQEKIEKHIAGTDETVPQFVDRAIDETIDRDNLMRDIWKTRDRIRGNKG